MTREVEVDDIELKLPRLRSQESRCDQVLKAYEEEEMMNGSVDTSKLETLPDLDFDVMKYVKVVTFKIDEKAEENPEVADLAVVKLPKIPFSRSDTGLQTGEDIRKNLHLNKDEIYSSYVRGDTENNRLKTDQHSESSPRLLKNYEFQRDLRYT